MYGSCIFCSARLGANDAVERFPVGRTLAFDGERGRLWAVCPACARWNLAPLEERWEAIDDAERLFRDTRLRVQSENIGLARLRDGTRLIRVGRTLPGELEVWRYSAAFARRAWGRRMPGVETVGRVLRGLGRVIVPFTPMLLDEVIGGSIRSLDNRRLAHRGRGSGVLIRRWHLRTAVLAPDGAGGVEMRFPWGLDVNPPGLGIGRLRMAREPAVIGGAEGDQLLSKAVTLVNGGRIRREEVLDAVHLLGGFGDTGDYVRWVADEELPLSKGGFWRVDRLTDTAVLNARGRLGLEIAVHARAERRAMEGELASLEAMWREAEQIADIADRLPDVPPSDPPRLDP